MSCADPCARDLAQMLAFRPKVSLPFCAIVMDRHGGLPWPPGSRLLLATRRTRTFCPSQPASLKCLIY